MIISDKRIEANRRNARLQSTGPKTPGKGRPHQSMNALKHNILSRQLVVQGYKIAESSDEFQALYQQYHEHLAPAGPLEEMLVDQIVSLTWRLRRARTAETGEIALHADHTWWVRNREENPAKLQMEWGLFGDPIHAMKQSITGSYLIQEYLRHLEDAVMGGEELTEDLLKNIARIFFGDKPNVLVNQFEKHRLKIQQNPENLDDDALREKNIQISLAFIGEKLLEYSHCLKDCLARKK